MAILIVMVWVTPRSCVMLQCQNVVSNVFKALMNTIERFGVHEHITIKHATVATAACM